MKKLKGRNILTPEQVLKLGKKLQTSNIKPAALAERFGISSSMLSNYITGRTSMPSWVFARLQSIFKFDEIKNE